MEEGHLSLDSGIQWSLCLPHSSGCHVEKTDARGGYAALSHISGITQIFSCSFSTFEKFEARMRKLNNLVVKVS